MTDLTQSDNNLTDTLHRLSLTTLARALANPRRQPKTSILAAVSVLRLVQSTNHDQNKSTFTSSNNYSTER